jgi:hypothetical protein
VYAFLIPQPTDTIFLDFKIQIIIGKDLGYAISDTEKKNEKTENKPLQVQCSDTEEHL